METSSLSGRAGVISEQYFGACFETIITLLKSNQRELIH